ncbi:MAG: molybdenum cofactor biosynthesis protein B [Thermocladium sp.]
MFKPSHESPRVEPVFGILVISDSRFRQYLNEGNYGDESGSAAMELLHGVGRTYNPVLVPNNPDSIRGAIATLQSMGANVIITIGGTGVGKRDITVDVVGKLCDKRVDGFGEAFRRLSEAELGPHAFMSRACACVVGDSIIFCLPGSPGAVKLAINSLIKPVISHLLGELIR